jgi:peroxiredoxin
LPQFEALGAQVVGVSADAAPTLTAFAKQEGVKHTLLGDFRRQMLPAWGVIQTDQSSPLFRYAKRAYFVIDKTGTIRYMKVMENPLDLLSPDELLAAVKSAGV